jgi:nucleoside-diphosphate-sugar epimerase
VRVLVIGGTVFLGRAIVEAALDRGDEVTYFHRGRHGKGLHPDAEEVLGDRATDLDRLPGNAWDAVIDTCGFDPEAVGGAARTLADRAAHYAFVSSASVYRGWPVAAVDEDSPLFEGDEQEYGPLKAAAERAAEAAMPGRVLHLRAGVIVGPHENIGRLPYWLRRMRQGGDVLAPEPRRAPIQLIDARDLARWVLAMASDCRAGVFNAVAPPGLLTWEELLELCRAVVNPHARLCWVDGERVAAALADPWSELPLWPAPVADAAAVYAIAADRAREAGLKIRPPAATVGETWAWLREGGEQAGWRSELRASGLDPELERRLLAELCEGA